MEALMGDVESEQSQDGLEVEIVDLDELASAPDASNSSNKRLLRPSQPLRFLARRRGLQLGVTTGVVVLVVLMILASTAPVREVVGSIFTGPTPTPSPAPGLQNDLFYFKTSPSWGYLTIDGHVVSHLPRMSVDPPRRLSPGQHVLVWRAAAFLAQRCTITVPAKPGVDSCRYDPPIEVGNGSFASIITFSESLNMLPATQRALLIQAVQAELGTHYSEMVQPGEPYALSSEIAYAAHNPCKLTSQVVLCYAIATQPLKATLSFQLDVDTSPDAPCMTSGSCSINGQQDCRLFCDASDIVGPMEYSMSAAAGWNVLVAVRPLWQFTTLDGQVIAHDQADTFIGGQGNEYLVMLNTVWGNPGWSILPPFSNSQLPFGDPVCDSAANDTEVMQNETLNNSGMQIQTQYPSVPRADLGAGCLVTITQQPASSSSLTPPPSSQVAYCLHRFGVLLAVNNLAHRLWPFLPVANAYEKRLAQQLAAVT
jgi:hypothetical protein